MEKTLKDIIRALNRAVKLDPAAVKRLIEFRTPCNEVMADSPRIQVRQTKDGCLVGMLGVINSFIPPIASFESQKLQGYGRITMVENDDGSICFIETLSL